MTESERAGSVAVATIDRSPIELAETTAAVVGIWGQQKWTTIEKLNPADLKRVAHAVVTAFPEFGPLEVTSYFDMLGGKLRPNAEFWMHAAARHPAYGGVEFAALKPGTEEWDEWLGEVDSGLVAGAFVATAYRTDRATPFREAGYVLRTDSMLYDYEWIKLPQAKSRADAERIAPAGADKFFLDRGENGRPSDGWKARVPTAKPDLVPLAKKKARSAAARRVLRLAFSLSEAKATALEHRVEQLLAGARDRHVNPEIPPAHAIAGTNVRIRAGASSAPPAVAEVEDVYGATAVAPEPERVVATASAPLRAQSTVTDPEPVYLDEHDRRKLYAWANERDLGGRTPHDVLHELLAEIQGLPLNEVSTKRIEYAEFEELRRRLDRFPPKDAIARGDAFEGDA